MVQSLLKHAHHGAKLNFDCTHENCSGQNWTNQTACYGHVWPRLPLPISFSAVSLLVLYQLAVHHSLGSSLLMDLQVRGISFLKDFSFDFEHCQAYISIAATQREQNNFYTLRFMCYLRTLWGEPEQGICSHCKPMTYTTQNKQKLGPERAPHR